MLLHKRTNTELPMGTLCDRVVCKFIEPHYTHRVRISRSDPPYPASTLLALLSILTKPSYVLYCIIKYELKCKFNVFTLSPDHSPSINPLKYLLNCVLLPKLLLLPPTQLYMRTKAITATLQSAKSFPVF